jgi:hypothetical protein
MQANARIGEAKALYFPNISLTGSYGSTSQQLSDLFTGPAKVWQGLVAFSVPIFDAGRIGATVDLAQARQRSCDTSKPYWPSCVWWPLHSALSTPPKSAICTACRATWMCWTRNASCSMRSCR